MSHSEEVEVVLHHWLGGHGLDAGSYRHVHHVPVVADRDVEPDPSTDGPLPDDLEERVGAALELDASRSGEVAGVEPTFPGVLALLLHVSAHLFSPVPLHGTHSFPRLDLPVP